MPCRMALGYLLPLIILKNHRERLQGRLFLSLLLIASWSFLFDPMGTPLRT